LILGKKTVSPVDGAEAGEQARIPTGGCGLHDRLHSTTRASADAAASARTAGECAPRADTLALRHPNGPRSTTRAHARMHTFGGARKDQTRIHANGAPPARAATDQLARAR
jgi:hypothetical protein